MFELGASMASPAWKEFFEEVENRWTNSSFPRCQGKFKRCSQLHHDVPLYMAFPFTSGSPLNHGVSLYIMVSPLTSHSPLHHSVSLYIMVSPFTSHSPLTHGVSLYIMLSPFTSCSPFHHAYWNITYSDRNRSSAAQCNLIKYTLTNHTLIHWQCCSCDCCSQPQINTQTSHTIALGNTPLTAV